MFKTQQNKSMNKSEIKKVNKEIMSSKNYDNYLFSPYWDKFKFSKNNVSYLLKNKDTENFIFLNDLLIQLKIWIIM